MAELKIKNLTYSIGDKTILDNITFSVTSGDRCCCCWEKWCW